MGDCLPVPSSSPSLLPHPPIHQLCGRLPLLGWAKSTAQCTSVTVAIPRSSSRCAFFIAVFLGMLAFHWGIKKSLFSASGLRGARRWLFQARLPNVFSFLLLSWGHLTLSMGDLGSRAKPTAQCTSVHGVMGVNRLLPLPPELTPWPPKAKGQFWGQRGQRRPGKFFAQSKFP